MRATSGTTAGLLCLLASLLLSACGDEPAADSGGGSGARSVEGGGETPASPFDRAERAWITRRPHISLLLVAGQRGKLKPCGCSEPQLGGIERLATLDLPQLSLAISVHSADDRVRSSLMPINRRYPLAELRKALAAYPLHKRRFFLVEYVLIKGVNDSKAAALQLAEYLAPLKVRVNLIAYNPGREDTSASGFARVDDDELNAFSDYLTELGLFVVKRWSKSQDLMAGCGQLSSRNTPGDPHAALHTHT